VRVDILEAALEEVAYVMLERERSGYAVTVAPRVPPALGAAVAACMARAPRARPSAERAREMLADAAAALTGRHGSLDTTRP
jgi:hypothetical protein